MQRLCCPAVLSNSVFIHLYTKNTACSVFNIKVVISATLLAFIRFKQRLQWIAQTDVLLWSPLCYAQGSGGAHHRLLIWRLPVGHGRRPAETASRHLSAWVCQARQETGVSHWNLPMQCTHQWKLIEGHEGGTGKILTEHCRHPDSISGIVICGWVVWVWGHLGIMSL